MPLSIVGRRVDPVRGMKFQVNIPLPGLGIINMGFSKISGLAQESEGIEYREGNEPPVQRKLPGLVKTEEVTLERGVAPVVQYDRLVEWRRAIEGLDTGGVEAFTFRALMEVIILNRAAEPTFLLRFDNCWIRRLEFADLDANASEVWLSRMVFTHEGLTPERVIAGPPLSLSASIMAGLGTDR